MNERNEIERHLLDLATLLAYAWYRDFPVDSFWRTRTLGRSDWTLHAASSVRFSAGMMGYFMHCEDSARTDAVLRNNKGTQIAAVEWEWSDLNVGPKYNELDKLKERVAQHGGIAVLICYVKQEPYHAELAKVADLWRGAHGPLLLMAITFQGSTGRGLRQVIMIRVDGKNGTCKQLRAAPALPWQVPGTRWEVSTPSEE